jgi:HEAT repeat protein
MKINFRVQSLNMLLLLSLNVFAASDISVLRKTYKDPKESINLRWKSLIVLCKKISNDCVKDINSTLSSGDWFMRSAALEAAKVISVHEAKRVARKLLDDKALVVRSAALDALAQNLSLEDRHLVWTTLTDSKNLRKGKSLWIRGQALEVLARSPQKNEAKQFSKILNDKDDSLHPMARNAINLIHREDFSSPLSMESSRSIR